MLMAENHNRFFFTVIALTAFVLQKDRESRFGDPDSAHFANFTEKIQI